MCWCRQICGDVFIAQNYEHVTSFQRLWIYVWNVYIRTLYFWQKWSISEYSNEFYFQINQLFGLPWILSKLLQRCRSMKNIILNLKRKYTSPIISIRSCWGNKVKWKICKLQISVVCWEYGNQSVNLFRNNRENKES